MSEASSPRWPARRGFPDPRVGPSLFIAVPLPDSATERIAELVRAVRRDPDQSDDGPRDPADVRWVRMSGLHLTLRFLGPTPRERIPDVLRVVDAVAADHAPFPVRVAGTGAFPSNARPRTLWLGIADGASALDVLARELAACLATSGWPLDDRPFKPHLTLARSDGVRAGPEIARALEIVAEETGFAVEFAVDRVVLFESRTGHGAARYEALHEAALTG